MSYAKRQAASGFAVGDKVSVIHKCDDHHDGWGELWIDSMDNFIGKECEIIGSHPTTGFLIFCEEISEDFNFPYFVLEKVGTTPEPEPDPELEPELMSCYVSFIVKRTNRSEYASEYVVVVAYCYNNFVYWRYEGGSVISKLSGIPEEDSCVVTEVAKYVCEQHKGWELEAIIN